MNFYFEAAGVLDKLDAKRGSIKGLIATVVEKNRKRTAALVIETLKYKQVLCDVIDASNLLKEERKKITSRNLALVLVHDLLLANGIQAGDGAVKQAVFRHKTRLNSEFQKIKVKRGAKSAGELARTGDVRADSIPRYVRVNSTCWTTEQAVKTFISRGYSLSGPFEDKGFSRDPHIENLLLFPPDTQFVDDPLYTDGKIILQDKASCFPAYILAPPPQDDSVVIDATAAPGNKTSHLCAMMNNKGKLFAFERDRKRFATLRTMLSRARCKNVEPVNADFLTVPPDDVRYAAVTHILLDPSCSGSGIVNRLDHLLQSDIGKPGEEDARLQKLAGFQLLMIRHAMKFPSVRRIVYSTCSVHAVENERVVREALKAEECLEGRFRLAPPTMVLPSWQRRGLPDEMDSPDDAASLIRCSPGDDATNGFFVALFIRDSEIQVTEGSDRVNVAKRKQTADSAQEDEEQPREKRRKRKKKGTAV